MWFNLGSDASLVVEVVTVRVVTRGCTARLYRRIGGIPEEYRETYRNRETFWTGRIFYSMY